MARSSKSSFPTEGGPCEALPVILVDAEESFRIVLALNLREDGHPVIELVAPPPLPLAGQMRRARVVIADHLPSHGCYDFADRLHETHALLPVVITTAHWNYHVQAQAARRGYVTLLRKPFGYEALHGLLHRLCGTEVHA